MLLSRTLLTSLVLFAGAAQALDTREVPKATLQAYGNTLNTVATKIQWQELWKNSRAQGAFQSTGNQPRFTVQQSVLPDLVYRTLSSATEVTPRDTTRALYRYDFAQPVGIKDQQVLTAVCLLVDWRSLPQNSAVDDTTRMGNIRLLETQPCL